MFLNFLSHPKYRIVLKEKVYLFSHSNVIH